MRRILLAALCKTFLVALSAAVTIGAQGKAETLSAGEILRITFSVDNDFRPMPPDYMSFGIHYVEVTEPFGSYTAALYDGEDLLGIHSDAAFGGYVGLVHLGSRLWKSPTSLLTVSNPTEIEFGTILDGTIDGRIDITIASGSMDVSFDGMTMQFVKATEWNAGTVVSPSPTILTISIIPEPHTFDRLELQTASLEFVHPGWDRFHFSAEFDPNENSDGVDPATEDVTVSFGTYTEVLPAGAFVCAESDCVYAGGGPGIALATISDGFLEVEANGVDLSGTTNRVEVFVGIGNDSGNAVALLSGRLKMCGLGFELAFLVPPLMWLYQRRRRRMQ